MDWNSIVAQCYRNVYPKGATDPSFVAKNVASISCIPALFIDILNVALAFSGTVAVLMIMWSGYKYVTSGGDPKQAGAARQIITYAILGLVVILLSFFIINLLSYLTGISCIKVFGFDNCSGGPPPNAPPPQGGPY